MGEKKKEKKKKTFINIVSFMYYCVKVYKYTHL